MQRSIALTILLASIVSLGSLSCPAQDAAQADKKAVATKQISSLMQMKLDKSKAILEGLAMEDYKAIASNSRALRLLSLESGWNVIQTPEYTKQSGEFKRATDLITEAAEKKDLGRATLGYVALTVRCVECHIYLREHQSGKGAKKKLPKR